MSKIKISTLQQQTLFKNKAILASFTPYSNPNNSYESFPNKFCHLEENLTKYSNKQSLIKAVNEEWRHFKHNIEALALYMDRIEYKKESVSIKKEATSSDEFKKHRDFCHKTIGKFMLN